MKRKIFWALGFLFVAFLIFIFLRELPEILEAMGRAKWHWLIAAVLLQIGTYFFLALLFADIFRFLGHEIDFRRLFKVAFSLNYLNQTVPSLGLSGLYFMLLALKKDNVPAGKSIATGIIYYILIHFTFILLLLYALFQLFISHQITRIQILATLGSAVIILGIVYFSIYTFRRKHIFKKILSLAIKPVKSFVLPFTSKRFNQAELEEFLNVDFLMEEIEKSFSAVGRAKQRIVLGLMYSFVIHLLDAATLFVLFLAFDFNAGFSVATIAFVFGSLFGFVSMVPSGIGVEEVTRGFVLNGFGVPLGIAFFVSIVFRALTFWFNIPLGAFAYRDLKKSLND